MNSWRYLDNCRSSLLEGLIRLLNKRTVITLLIILVIGILITLIPLQKLSDELIESNALQNARLYSQAITEFRTVYTSEVVSKMEAQGVDISHDYHDKENAIPLPATLSMLLGKRIGEKGNGGATKLYSPYPFPWREKEGGLRDEFAKEAWEALSNNPTQPHYEIVDQGGEKVLQYATADLLRPSCVNCHNSHPQTPKVGWKVGDVRGVLQVSLPLDKVTAQSQTGIKTTMVYSVGMTLIILFLLGIVIKRLGRANMAIEEYSNKREETTKELFFVIDEEKRRLAANLHDNIGQIISSAKVHLTRLDLEEESISDKKKEFNKTLEMLLNDAYMEVKNLSYSILPEKLLSLGLVNAISELIARTEEISEIAIQFNVKCEEEALSDDLKSAIYTMVQETMNNIIKHADATEVILQLIQNESGIILMVEDNGIGFDIGNLPAHDGLGIKNLYSRTNWLNGTIDINSRAGHGTIITIEYPV